MDIDLSRLAFATWQRYLSVTYGQFADRKSDGSQSIRISQRL
jgi:hypothetical protein